MLVKKVKKKSLAFDQKKMTILLDSRGYGNSVGGGVPVMARFGYEIFCCWFSFWSNDFLGLIHRASYKRLS